jgi:Endonuclease I/Secretion system C-terminal sorting domain
MMIKKLLLLVLVCNFGYSQVVINELDTDNPSTDTKEFVELKSDIPNFSLNGYVLVFYNGAFDGGNLSYLTIDLDGLTTNINGIVTIGNNGVSPYPSWYLPDSSIQNGADGVGLYLGNASDFPIDTIASSTNLVDALIYGTSDPDATSLMTALNETIQWDENSNSAGQTQSIQRKNDGTYEVKIPTPGVNNDGSGILFNGITILVSTANITEQHILPITFTTQTNVTSDLNFEFTLNNKTFNTSDFTGSTMVSIVAGTNSFSTNIQLIDDALDEGDEVLRVHIGAIPFGYDKLNNNIEVRIVDNDFTTASWGTPLLPTYGLVSSTTPLGYYNAIEGLSGTLLKQTLQDIIANPATVHAQNYGDIIDMLKQSDQNPANSNQVWLMYVEQPRAKLDFQTSNSSIGTWNREHIFPQSRGGYTDGTLPIPDGIDLWLPTNADDILAGHADAHHIRAEDGPENSSRNNRDYGLNDYNGPAGTLGSWKGDVARSLFYMAVRYNALSLVNGNPPDTTLHQLGDLASLLLWNKTDPSDDFEMNRNNIIYTWQQNRNPFIDYPDLADYIWGSKAGQPWFTSLSVKDESVLQIGVYPNPIDKYLVINGLVNEAKITIYAISGVKVFESNYSNNDKLYLNLNSGMYMLKVNSNNKSIIKKLIVK